MQPDWRRIDYLKGGSSRQRAAFVALQKIQILDILKDYDPILVGTIPIGVDVIESDLDIICETNSIRRFETLVVQNFGNRDGFQVQRKNKQGMQAVVAQFKFDGFKFEIFGQEQPTDQQNAFKHMVAEYRVLHLCSEHVRLKIKRLRNSGTKTEPAFAKILNLAGDPYDAVANLYNMSDAELTSIIDQAELV